MRRHYTHYFIIFYFTSVSDRLRPSQTLSVNFGRHGVVVGVLCSFLKKRHLYTHTHTHTQQ